MTGTTFLARALKTAEGGLPADHGNSLGEANICWKYTVATSEVVRRRVEVKGHDVVARQPGASPPAPLHCDGEGVRFSPLHRDGEGRGVRPSARRCRR